MFKLLIFAGTTEGRTLLQALSKAAHKEALTVFACVATDYGKDLLPQDDPHVHIMAGRRSEQEMVDLIEQEGIQCVIDTTHPYARVVTENIQEACRKTGCAYLRVVRTGGDGITAGQGRDGQKGEIPCLFFESHEEVVHYLSQTTGKVFMTIGSKELAAYTALPDYKERLFVRVLPMAEVLESCFKLGFQGRQLAAMQGPFSYSLNLSMLEQVGAKFLVTKYSGDPGGYAEKLQAAATARVTALVIGRQEEEGLSVEETLNYLTDRYGLCFEEGTEEPGVWFPLFTNISGKQIVVFGGGKIAKRRILTFARFDCKVKVVSKDALPDIAELAEAGKIQLHLKAYEPADLAGADIVLAATNKPEINEEIHARCKEKGIIVNVANNKEKSDFYFPGLIRKDGLTIGVTAEGKNHGLAKRATRAILNLDFLKGE